MSRIRDTRVGVRLAVAFGVLVVLIVAVAGVGMWSASRQRAAEDRIVEANNVSQDLLEMKFEAADFSGSETGYAFDAVRGTPGATDDTVGRRKQFLLDVQAFRDANANFLSHELDGADAALHEAFFNGFEQFMVNDAQIIALLRSGSPADVVAAGDLLAGAQVEVFDAMSAKADELVAEVRNDADKVDRSAATTASTSRSIMLAIGLVAVLLAVLLAVFMTRSLIRPLHESVDVLQAMAGGDLRRRVASPAKDEVGQMGTAMNHSLDRLGETVNGIAEGSDSLSSSSEELSAVSQQLSAAAEETAAQAMSVSAAAEQVSNNIQSVAAGAEQLGTSIQEIARNTSDAARVATEAVSAAEATNETVTKLGVSSAEIGEVVRVITSIAERTNLLALNATIEAARAGEAGKGFAVVANEVKDLARKTARSSEEIGRKVESIQADTAHAVEAIGRISTIVLQINDIQTVIAASVEEQAATTSEIGRSVTEAAAGSSEIARNITGVAETAQGVTQAAAETHRAAADLAGLANQLLGLVNRFQIDSSEPVARPKPAAPDAPERPEYVPFSSKGNLVLAATAARTVNDGDGEIVLAFLDESRENLDQLDDDLVALEATPSDPRLLAQVFRTIHTIKGTCGFLGFHHLEALTHGGENLLGALRDGRLELDAAITTTLLALVDDVRVVLERIERTGAEGDDDHRSMIAALDRHLQAPTDVPGNVDVNAAFDGDVAEPASASALATGSETTVRVDVSILDKLMDLVGELVLTRSQFGDSAATGDDGTLSLPYRQLRLLTSELQEGVMRARLQPIGTVTGRLRRVVRDLAAALGKQIRIEMEGEEIAVDKAVNEALRDPLLHLVRNAVDHGIEPPDDRRAAGKPATGTVTLRAFHEGGRVHIDLADDGRGIDPSLLVEKAIATGVLTPDEAAGLRPDEALDLMFRAGLSTKEEITNISGRGVGMDVVRAALERVGGSIDVTSESGIGSRFRLTVPLTLAIMPVLVASVGAQRFAVPQVDVQEVVFITAEDMATAVDDVEGALIYRLRDGLLPLVDLATLFRLAPVRDGSGLAVIVVETVGRRVGIVVDGIGDTTEVVVKPLPRATRAIRLFGGVTILSDGEPALIVDVGGVATAAGITATRATDAGHRADVPLEAPATLLLATGADGSRIAVEIAGVRRLEQIASESVERAGGLEVVQYRGGILPLVRVGDARTNGDVPAPPTGMLQAVVCQSSMGLVGLVVDQIDDVVDQPSAPPQPPSRRGVIAGLIVNDQLTELLDVESLIADAGLGQPA